MPQPLNILLVDDDPMVRSIFQEFLSSINHSVIEATDGRQAIDIFNAVGHAIDLIITDLRMPIMNGVTLVRHVRQSRSDLPIAVVTGYADDEAIDIVRQLATRIYRKPLDFSTLASFLDELAGQQGLQPAAG